MSRRVLTRLNSKCNGVGGKASAGAEADADCVKVGRGRFSEDGDFQKREIGIQLT